MIDVDLALESVQPLLLGLLQGTIPLTLASFAVGLVLAVGLALARLSGRVWFSAPARFLVSIIRGTPLLLQLVVIFYVLPEMGVNFSPFIAAIIAFSVNVGGYASEIVRAAILSVPSGQQEAATSLGMTRAQSMLFVILPQAVRVSIPPLSNTLISLVKDTSLASSILVTEMFRKAQEIASSNFAFVTLYITAGALYWVVCLVMSFAQTRLERHFSKFAV